jgi:hypothetical protein
MEDDSRHYLRTLRSACYDQTGITYPKRLPMDLEAIVRYFGGINLLWEREFGWDNQPEVLVFEMTEETKDRLLVDRLWPLGLNVIGRWTDKETKMPKFRLKGSVIFNATWDVEAESAEAAIRRVREEGLTPDDTFDPEIQDWSLELDEDQTDVDGSETGEAE